MLRLAWAWLLSMLQRRCQHPGDCCAYDILQGALDSYREPPAAGENTAAYTWCRICGAYKVSGYAAGREYDNGWRAPDAIGQVAERDRLARISRETGLLLLAFVVAACAAPAPPAPNPTEGLAAIVSSGPSGVPVAGNPLEMSIEEAGRLADGLEALGAPADYAVRTSACERYQTDCYERPGMMIQTQADLVALLRRTGYYVEPRGDGELIVGLALTTCQVFHLVEQQSAFGHAIESQVRSLLETKPCPASLTN